MIMGHVGFGQIFDKYIHAFHMPMWFIISGYFINLNRPFKSYLHSKLKVLIIPYIIFSLSYEIIWSILGHSRWEALVWPNSLLIPLNGALWFLPAMFFADIIGYGLLKGTKRNYFTFILTLIVVSFVGTSVFCKLPFSFDSGLVGVSLLMTGYALREKGLPHIRGCLLYITILLSIILVFINGYINVRLNLYAFSALFYLNAILSTIVYWNIARIITVKYEHRLSFFYEVGRYSLLYVCVNEFLIVLLSKFSFGDLVGKVASRLFEVIIIIVICFLINRVLLNSRLKFLIGK